MSQKVVPFLWFEDKADEAMEFYVSVFKDSKVVNVTRLKDVPGPEGKVITGLFEIAGQEFMVLNGGPQEGFKFSPAISFFVRCADQAEIDDLWSRLTAVGGKEGQCGWLTDKYGVTWQIVPENLSDWIGGPDADGAKRAMECMLKMTKLEIPALKKAYEG